MSDRKYPSILELALKAGKWSVIAGSSAVIISGAGCNEPKDNPDNGFVQDVLAGVVIYPDITDSDTLEVWMGRDAAELEIPGQDVIGYELTGDDPGASFGPDVDVIDVLPFDSGAFIDDSIEPFDDGNIQDAIGDAEVHDSGLSGDDIFDVEFPPSDTTDELDAATSADPASDD
jgi:hypothetical protein